MMIFSDEIWGVWRRIPLWIDGGGNPRKNSSDLVDFDGDLRGGEGSRRCVLLLCSRVEVGGWLGASELTEADVNRA